MTFAYIAQACLGKSIRTNIALFLAGPSIGCLASVVGTCKNQVILRRKPSFSSGGIKKELS